MNSIGVDLHKETVLLVVLNDKGEIVDRKTFATKCKNMIKAYFSSYGLQCQVDKLSECDRHEFNSFLRQYDIRNI